MAKANSCLGLILLGIIFSVILLENEVSGQCCHASRGRCGDGTDGTPCCGHRSCNFFCCSCGTCRGKRWTRDVSAGHEHDKNKDGFYDKNELHAKLLSGSCGNYTEKVAVWEQEFHKLDADKDGKLSYAEIGG